MSALYASEHVRPQDDLRHRVPDGVVGRDSLFWNLLLPEHDLAVQDVRVDGRTGPRKPADRGVRS